MASVDFKKELKAFYVPSSKHPVIVDVPVMQYLMVDGVGDPNDSESFHSSIEALYGLSYALKMLPKQGITPFGHFDYVVPPLEGIWDIANGTDYEVGRKDKFRWTLMIMQPAFITAELVDQVREKVRKKKNNPLTDQVRLASLDEGTCVQMLHIGSYDDEPRTVLQLEHFAEEEGYSIVKSGHHEIYLGDPARTAPEKLKTTLRYPLKLHGHQ